MPRSKRAYHYTLDPDKIANANASDLEGLITSRFSNVVYRQDEVHSDFLILLLIVVIGKYVFPFDVVIGTYVFLLTVVITVVIGTYLFLVFIV